MTKDDLGIKSIWARGYRLWAIGDKNLLPLPLRYFILIHIISRGIIMQDIDTCKHGLKPQCAEIANPVMAEFLELVKRVAVTVESIDAINEVCENCSSFEAKP